ncbi:MAG: DNA polymerase III subunit delta [Coriobacteriales bacterium]|jgi:DNA polymerase-3 subunit delta|nr:DNA polymerase III subunit delta [Coriobacteriales bacterium]
MPNSEHGLLPVYLFCGDDQLKMSALSKRLLQRLEKDGDTTFDSQVFEGSQPLSKGQLLDALNTPPLASPFRLITVRDVDKVGSVLTDSIIDYLQRPLATTVLVLTATKMTATSRLYKALCAISPKAVLDSTSKKRSELPQMVRRLAGDYGLTVEPDANLALVDLIGNSSVALNTELRKLASYAKALGKSSVGASDVHAVVARAHQYSAWDFVDAFAGRDLQRCIALMDMMPDQSPLGIVAFCIVRIRELMQVKALQARRGVSLEKALRRPQWQIKRLLESSANFSVAHLRQILAKAASIDMQMKSGADAQQALLEFLIFALATD